MHVGQQKDRREIKKQGEAGLRGQEKGQGSEQKEAGGRAEDGAFSQQAMEGFPRKDLAGLAGDIFTHQKLTVTLFHTIGMTKIYHNICH